jgi:phosphatidylinositol glycan class B
VILPLGDRSWRRLLALWLGTSLLLIFVAAVQSDGYHHADEYFQTLEFAGAKLGRTPVQDLPWEHSAGIRSWLQPGLYYLGARAWTALGVEDPFAWTLSFRLFSGLLAWLATLGLALCVPAWFPGEEARRMAVRFLCVAWFVPYLAVRTSSESLASSCLALGLALLVLTHPNRGQTRRTSPAVLLTIGLFFGLACELRFAVGIAVVALLAWAALVARVPVRGLVWIGLGLSIVVAGGTVVDRWGYGRWVFPPYEYFAVNLLKNRAAERFGALPWYGYVALAAAGPTAPLALLLMAAALFAWLRQPLHPLTWAAAPFVVVHSLIQHKEMRFLFPVAALSLVSAVQAVAPMGDAWDPWLRWAWEARRRPIARLLVAVNLLALALLCVTPTRPQLGFQRFVWRLSPARFEAYLLTPFSPWVADGLPMYFYRPRTLRLHPATDVAEIEALGLPRFLLVTGSFDAPESPGGAYACVPLYRSMPYWLREVVGESMDRVPAWNLYRCVPKAGLPSPG